LPSPTPSPDRARVQDEVALGTARSDRTEQELRRQARGTRRGAARRDAARHHWLHAWEVLDAVTLFRVLGRVDLEADDGTVV